METRNLLRSSALALMATAMIANGVAFAQTVSVTSLNDAEFTSALTWAHTQGMTKFADEQSFKPFDVLTREQAAKFFAEFAKKELGKEADTTVNCTYSDAAQIDPTLMASVTESCQLGLFQGYQGKFDPKQPLTKAQALTVLVRALVGKQDESGIPRWSVNFTVAQQHGWTKETNVLAVDKYVTRYEALLLEFRAKGSADTTTTVSETGTDLSNVEGDQLSQILQELFGENFSDTTGATSTGSTTSTGSMSLSGDVQLSGAVVTSGSTVGSGT